MRFTRWSVPVTGAAVLALLWTVVPVQATDATGTAPGRSWDAPVLVSASQASRETSIALSPTDPELMVVCDPSGVPNIPNGQSYFHRSTDGGQTWAFLDVEGGATDTRNYAFEGGDCDVAFDAGGTMYSADTWLGNLSVGHSRDGGDTWDGTALATTTPVVDRPWIVGGPEGTVYVSYQDLQCCMVSAIFFTKSTDYGETFLPAVPVTTANESGAFTWEGNFVVSDDGQDVYLVYTRRNALPLTSIDGNYAEQVYVAASHDGGLTWTSHLVAEMPRPASYLYPSVAMGGDGVLHVVFASRRSGDRPIWYSSSSDGAETWATPIPLSEGSSGVAPWVVTDAAGDALVAWLHSPDPAATGSTMSPWYVGWARVSGGGGTPTVTHGTTTTEPLFVGRQTMPEFNQLRVDADGLVHVGASVFRERENGPSGWAIYYQRERLDAL